MTDEQITTLIETTVRATAPPDVTYPAKLPFDMRLRDLNMDSIALVEAVVSLEKELGARFTDTELQGVQSLRDLVRLVRTRIPA